MFVTCSSELQMFPVCSQFCAHALLQWRYVSQAGVAPGAFFAGQPGHMADSRDLFVAESDEEVEWQAPPVVSLTNLSSDRVTGGGFSLVAPLGLTCAFHTHVLLLFLLLSERQDV